MSSITGVADCWKPICQGDGCPMPASAAPAAASASDRERQQRRSDQSLEHQHRRIRSFAIADSRRRPAEPRSVPRRTPRRLAHGTACRRQSVRRAGAAPGRSLRASQTIIPPYSQCASCGMREAAATRCGMRQSRICSDFRASAAQSAAVLDTVDAACTQAARGCRAERRFGHGAPRPNSARPAAGTGRHGCHARDRGVSRLRAAAAGACRLSLAAGGRSGAGRGQVGAWRLADPLRHAARRAGRAMRADPERDRRGPRQCRPHRDRAEDRRPEEPADAGARAARRAAAVRASASRSTMPMSAAPASCAACRTAASPRW